AASGGRTRLAADRSSDAHLPGAAHLGQPRAGWARLVYRLSCPAAAGRRTNGGDRVSLAGRPGGETHASRVIASAVARRGSVGETGRRGVGESADQASDRRNGCGSGGESSRTQRQAARRGSCWLRGNAWTRQEPSNMRFGRTSAT